MVSKQPIRFQAGQEAGTPEDATQPVWLVQPCSVWQRPTWERIAAQVGPFPVRPAALGELLVAAVDQFKPEAERAEAHALLARAQAIADKDGEVSEEEKQAVLKDTLALQTWAASVEPVYARLWGVWVSEVQAYLHHRQMLAAALFVVGVEHVDVPLARRGDLLTDETLEAIAAAGHWASFLAAGGRALELLGLAEGRRKN